MKPKPLSNWSIRSQVLAGPLILFLILSILLITAGFSTWQIRTSDATIGETVDILQSTSRLARQVVDMETAVRGYILTGNQQYLQPYHQARQQYPTTIDGLGVHFADQPDQAQRLALLERQIDGWVTMVGEVEIDLVNRNLDPVAMVRSGVGRMRMGEIRTTLDALEDAAYAQLAVQTREHEEANQVLLAIYIGAGLLALAALILAVRIGRHIADPVVELEQAANHIAAGRFVEAPRGLTWTQGNELGRTQLAFMDMVNALAQARTELVEQAATLADAAQQARQARNETAAVLDAVAEAILVISPEGKVIAANQRVTDMFGMTPTTLLEMDTEEIRRFRARIFADTDALDTYVGAALAAPAPVQNRLILQQQWPTPRELELFTAPVVDPAHELRAHVLAFRDITKEREADRLKNEFVSMVSHELRTPLTSIKGFVDLLVSGDAGQVSEEQAEFLEVVKNNADRLVALVNDLLDISRLEAGRVELHRTNIAVDALLRSLLVSLRPQIDAKRHTVEHNFPKNLPPVFGDAERISQIFINLLSNAIKYTPTGGRIALAITPEKEQIRVDIQDNGIGLSEADQARLFTRFFRAKNRTTQEAGGTGLGLSITKSLIEMHGGSIQVHSEPGVGSTFSVFLPVTEDPATSRAQQTLYPGGRILVVEDEPDIAELIRVYLTRAEYEVDTAGDATTALESAKRQPPDLILLDLVLPGVSGMTLLSWIKSDEALATIPVVLISIMPDDGQGRMLGAVEYLAKPIQKDLLLNRIGSILSTEQTPTVLIVDDDIGEREHIRSLLHRAGYRTVTAGAQDDILLRIAESEPDLILVDLPVPPSPRNGGTPGALEPDVHGANVAPDRGTNDGTSAVLEQLRHSDRIQQIPVVLMTGYLGDTAPLELSMLDSMQNVVWLSKPFTVEQLAQTISGRVADV